MKIYFGDPEYDGQFLRAVDYTPAGAQIGEAWAPRAPVFEHRLAACIAGCDAHLS